ncbi:alpha carbonic anhydrase 8-like [Archocentrus centrarchus]|uniref:alpha carbonic anhydrase 8-like n=1 Tax=Archocentrus centrarchus TaxID=63155 RepID=UPI0011E9E576|nr:alpha carbonic anhydrase 8-like [Archocentrus centrarchus]
MAEAFPHGYESASRYESSVQPGSSLGVYGASHGSYINGYLQQGGASSYRPGSMSSSRLRQPHKQSHYQVKTDGVFQSKDAMSDFALPQKGNRLQAGIVSSYAIEMRSEPQQPNNDAKLQPLPEHQQPHYRDSKPRPQPVPLPHQQQPRYEDSKPRPQPVPLPHQQQPRYEDSKPRPQPVPLPHQQQPRYEDSKPRPQPVPLPHQQQPRYEASKLPSAGVLQTKTGMWDLAINSNAGPRSLTPGYHYRQPHQLVPFYNRYQP